MTAIILILTITGLFATMQAVTWTHRQRRCRDLLNEGRSQSTTPDEINEYLNRQAS